MGCFLERAFKGLMSSRTQPDLAHPACEPGRFCESFDAADGADDGPTQ